MSRLLCKPFLLHGPIFLLRTYADACWQTTGIYINSHVLPVPMFQIAISTSSTLYLRFDLLFLKHFIVGVLDVFKQTRYVFGGPGESPISTSHNEFLLSPFVSSWNRMVPGVSGNRQRLSPIMISSCLFLCSLGTGWCCPGILKNHHSLPPIMISSCLPSCRLEAGCCCKGPGIPGNRQSLFFPQTLYCKGTLFFLRILT